MLCKRVLWKIKTLRASSFIKKKKITQWFVARFLNDIEYQKLGLKSFESKLINVTFFSGFGQTSNTKTSLVSLWSVLRANSRVDHGKSINDQMYSQHFAVT